MASTPLGAESHYYTDSRFLVVRAQSTIFRFPLEIFISRCKSFVDRVAVPSRGELTRGVTDDDPVTLEDVASDEFQAFMDYIFPSLVPVSFSIDGLEGILKLSQMYSVEDGISFALQKIESEIDSISPARLLSIAIKYRIFGFFKRAFRALADVPLHNLSINDIGLIPPFALCKLLAARRGVIVHRQGLVLNKPLMYRNNVRSASCVGECVSQMKNRWDTVVTQMLLSSEWHSAESISKAMQNALENDRICRGCTELYRCHYEFDLMKGESRVINPIIYSVWDSEGGNLGRTAERAQQSGIGL